MLNSKQMKIVNSNEKSIFVVSGAGTGKTTVIYNRILHLLSKNIKARFIEGGLAAWDNRECKKE